MHCALASAVQTLHTHYMPVPTTLHKHPTCPAGPVFLGSPLPALPGLTQVILVQRDLLHQRRHDKREGLAVEVVQAVASKHGREDHSAVIAVASGRHGGKEQALLAGTQSL